MVLTLMRGDTNDPALEEQTGLFKNKFRAKWLVKSRKKWETENSTGQLGWKKWVAKLGERNKKFSPSSTNE